MTETLAVELNRDKPYAIEPAVQQLETTGSFVIAVKNEGAGRHVHLQLSNELAAAASVDEGTHFVDSGSIWSTTVDVHSSHRPIEGTLTLSMGYGQETADVAVRITEPTDAPVEPKPSPQEQPTSQEFPSVRHVRTVIVTGSLSKTRFVIGGLVLILLVVGFWWLWSWLVAGVILLSGSIIMAYFMRKADGDSEFHR